VKPEIYAESYVLENARPAGGRGGPSVADQILDFLEKEIGDGFVDSRTISESLHKNSVQINMVLRKMRQSNKIDFRWVKSQRSDRSLIVYRHPKFMTETKEAKEKTTVEPKTPDTKSKPKK